jgi:hypothetical protein
MLVLLFAGCFSLIWFVCFVAVGVIVFVRARPKLRWLGGGLLALALAVPAGCYLAPGIQFRQQYGRDPLPHYPAGVIHEGMTKEEVLTKLGDPYSTYSNASLEFWRYSHYGRFGTVSDCVVYFDVNEVVERVAFD